MKKKEYRILVVDDDPLMIKLINFYLSSENYKINSAMNGRKALSILHKEEFDLILADMQMPEIDGATLSKRIKEELKIKAPIIILTAYTPIDSILDRISGYAYEIIRKPFTSNQLNKCVSKALNRKVS